MAAQAEDWLGRWAMNLMLINVSTRKLRRAVRQPHGRAGRNILGGEQLNGASQVGHRRQKA